MQRYVAHSFLLSHFCCRLRTIKSADWPYAGASGKQRHQVHPPLVAIAMIGRSEKVCLTLSPVIWQYVPGSIPADVSALFHSTIYSRGADARIAEPNHRFAASAEHI